MSEDFTNWILSPGQAASHPHLPGDGLMDVKACCEFQCMGWLAVHVEMVTGLGEGKGLENFVTIYHTCSCPYDRLKLRVFGPLATHPSQGGQEGIFPALEPRAISQQGPWPMGSLHHPIVPSISWQGDWSAYPMLSTVPSPLPPLVGLEEVSIGPMKAAWFQGPGERESD